MPTLNPFRYERQRTLKELKIECDRLDWEIVRLSEKHEDKGLVGIHFSSNGGTAGKLVLNISTGAFFGRTNCGIVFKSSDPAYETRPWYREILDAIFTN